MTVLNLYATPDAYADEAPCFTMEVANWELLDGGYLMVQQEEVISLLNVTIYFAMEFKEDD